jgi:hypothetical protein
VVPVDPAQELGDLRVRDDGPLADPQHERKELGRRRPVVAISERVPADQVEDDPRHGAFAECPRRNGMTDDLGDVVDRPLVSNGSEVMLSAEVNRPAPHGQEIPTLLLERRTGFIASCHRSRAPLGPADVRLGHLRGVEGPATSPRTIHGFPGRILRRRDQALDLADSSSPSGA